MCTENVPQKVCKKNGISNIHYPNNDLAFTEDEVIINNYEIADGEAGGSHTETINFTIPETRPPSMLEKLFALEDLPLLDWHCRCSIG